MGLQKTGDSLKLKYYFIIKFFHFLSVFRKFSSYFFPGVHALISSSILVKEKLILKISAEVIFTFIRKGLSESSTEHSLMPSLPCA